MASSMRSRRRATAIAVPGTVAVLLAGAYAAAPALAASTSPTLPFPSVCPTGQSAPANGTAATSSASTSKSPTAKATPSAGKSAPATPGAGGSIASPTPSATPTGTATPANAPNATGSPTSSTATSGSGNGFWGWLNGVWTWIFSDSPQTATGHSAVEDGVAPLTAAHAVAAAAALGQRQAAASASPNCVSAQQAAKLAAAAAASPSEGVTASTIPWVMKTSEMTMWNLTFNGVKSVKVWDPSSKSYVDKNVLDFTASSLTIQSMVTYSIQNGQTVYNNAGSGTTTTLTNPHLMVESMTADLYGLVGQTYDPDHLPPLPVGVTVPLVPVIFTNVTSVISYLNTDSISVPGFNGFASAGVAEPQ